MVHGAISIQDNIKQLHLNATDVFRGEYITCAEMKDVTTRKNNLGFPFLDTVLANPDNGCFVSSFKECIRKYLVEFFVYVSSFNSEYQHI